MSVHEATEGGTLAPVAAAQEPAAPPPRRRARRRDRRAGARSRTGTTRQAVIRFGLASLLVAMAVGAVGAVAGRRAAQQESIEDASRVTQVLAHSVVEPNVQPALLRGDPQAIARLDAVVPGKVTTGSLVRVKIWTPDGRIVYSDEHRLIGATYGLGAAETAAIKARKVDAQISDLTAPENRFERGQGPMLEVYLPIWTTDHQVLLFETYSRYHEVVSAPAGSVWRDFLPITLGALLLLQLLQLPLAWRTARRLDSSVEERERLAREATEASATERRRIAADLHDSVVQDLAAVSYTLAGIADRSRGPDQDKTPLRTAAVTVRRSIQALRTLLVEIYPDSLQNEGLASALTDLAAPLAGRRIDVRLDLTDDLGASRTANELAFRVAAESLRNIAAHSGATTVTITLRRVVDMVELLVVDDGRGFDPRDPRNLPESGHLGLALLRDRVARVGGELMVDSRPGGGTSVHLVLPSRVSE